MTLQKVLEHVQQGCTEKSCPSARLRAQDAYKQSIAKFASAIMDAEKTCGTQEISQSIEQGEKWSRSPEGQKEIQGTIDSVLEKYLRKHQPKVSEISTSKLGSSERGTGTGADVE